MPADRAYLETVRRYSRWPHREPAGGESDPAHAFLRLACLNYGADDRERWRRASAQLAAQPGLARASIHTIAAVGDVAAARAELAREPSLARRSGGPHDWEPLLYLCYARLEDTAPGYSPLEVARLLLAHGADPDAGYLWEELPSPFTAVCGALGGGEQDQPPHRDALALARLLLAAGADANDSQALYNRQFRAADEHLELLFEFGLGRGSGGPWHARLGAAHQTPAQMLAEQLLWAARQDMPARVRLLLAHGVDPDGKAGAHPVHRGGSPCDVALLSGNAEIVALLSAAGASSSADPVLEFSGACMRGDRATVERLLAADPDLVARASASQPELLIRAAEHGRTDAVRLMVALGFEVNARLRHTPLHGAASNGHLETVKALLELGADTTIHDTEFDATPLGWAQHCRQAEVAACLAALPH